MRGRGLIRGDRVGLGWRTELAPSILSNPDQIDAVEVILDDYFDSPISKLRALSTLAGQVPVIYHGVGLGLASSIEVDGRRLDRLARVLDYLAPDQWSEHLAFVRAGGIEIGHLAAPPRSEATVHGALENLLRIKQAVGSLPALENIATLIDPPGSKLTEPEWVDGILSGSGCGLLLDLHNLYANAINFGFDPMHYLSAFPLQRVALVHLSGGKWIDEPAGFSGGSGNRNRADGKRLLDDHVHDVPGIVFEMLEFLARKTLGPLTVILERDGEYPDFQVLLAQLARAREAIRRGRDQQASAEGGVLERARG